MSKGQKWFVLFILLGVGIFAVQAQQQFSGGQSVSISGSLPTGANVIGHVVVDSAPTTAVTGTFWQATQPTSLAALPALAAGTAKVGITYPYTGCGTTLAESGSPAGFAALSASTVTVFSATTCIESLVVSNTGAASFTYYVTDNAGTPIAVIGSSGNPITILPGERDEYSFPNGVKFNAGLKLTSSAATGAFYAMGVQ